MALLSLSELREMSMTYSISLQILISQKETEINFPSKPGKFNWGYLTENDDMEVTFWSQISRFSSFIEESETQKRRHEFYKHINIYI